MYWRQNNNKSRNLKLVSQCVTRNVNSAADGQV